MCPNKQDYLLGKVLLLLLLVLLQLLLCGRLGKAQALRLLRRCLQLLPHVDHLQATKRRVRTPHITALLPFKVSVLVNSVNSVR